MVTEGVDDKDVPKPSRKVQIEVPFLTTLGNLLDGDEEVSTAVRRMVEA